MQPLSSESRRGVVVRHHVVEFSDRWRIYEGPVPEAHWHYAAAECLRALLALWVERGNRNAFVYRNMAVRVREDQPNVGFDPDVCLVKPAPPDAESVESLKLWLPEHAVPCLTFEIVSKNHLTKDYVEIPDKCAAAGVSELVLFDPLLCGPKAHGGPRLLQVWRRARDGAFERVHAADGPAHCHTLDAWLRPLPAERLLGLSHDPEGRHPWLTQAQAERAEKEAERAEKEAERAEKEMALRRVAELEAELARQRK